MLKNEPDREPVETSDEAADGRVLLDGARPEPPVDAAGAGEEVLAADDEAAAEAVEEAAEADDAAGEGEAAGADDAADADAAAGADEAAAADDAGEAGLAADGDETEAAAPNDEPLDDDPLDDDPLDTVAIGHESAFDETAPLERPGDYAMVATITADDLEPEAAASAQSAASVQADASDSTAASAEDGAGDAAEAAGPAARVNEPRDLGLGQKTAEGLATMTPIARQTGAGERELGEVALRLEGLTKLFGSHRAVDDVSYEVRQGSFSGIVGPNGAGKTTTLMMMSGLLVPTRGTVHVGETDVWREPRVAHRKIGILPDRLRMFDQLTGAQYLGYVGTVRGLDREAALARTESLLDKFELRGSANRLVVDYSSGMRKKLALAATLIHSPEVLILDEPFESIDPVSAGVLIDVLIDYADHGGTVVLSSHSMDLVQRVCDHVAVIVKGEVIAEGTVDEVRGDITLEERFRHIVRGPAQPSGLDWLEISFG